MYTLNKCAYGPRRKNAQLLGQIGDLPSSDSVAKAQDICDRKRGCAGFTKGRFMPSLVMLEGREGNPL